MSVKTQFWRSRQGAFPEEQSCQRSPGNSSVGGWVLKEGDRARVRVRQAKGALGGNAQRTYGSFQEPEYTGIPEGRRPTLRLSLLPPQFPISDPSDGLHVDLLLSFICLLK